MVENRLIKFLFHSNPWLLSYLPPGSTTYRYFATAYFALWCHPTSIQRWRQGPGGQRGVTEMIWQKYWLRHCGLERLLHWEEVLALLHVDIITELNLLPRASFLIGIEPVFVVHLCSVHCEAMNVSLTYIYILNMNKPYGNRLFFFFFHASL